MVGSWQLSKHTGAIKKMLGDNVVIGSLRKVFDTVEYDPFGKISGTEIDSAHMAFPFTHQGSGGSDLVRAAYKGLPVTFSDVELFQIDSQYDEQLQQWRDTKQRIFQGQWFTCGLDAPLSGALAASAAPAATGWAAYSVSTGRTDRSAGASAAVGTRFAVRMSRPEAV